MILCLTIFCICSLNRRDNQEPSRKRFDVFIDLFSNPRNTLTRLSGAPVRIGKDKAGRGRRHTHRIKDDGNPKTANSHFITNISNLLTSKKKFWQTEIFLKEEERKWEKDVLIRYGLDRNDLLSAYTREQHGRPRCGTRGTLPPSLTVSP